MRRAKFKEKINFSALRKETVSRQHDSVCGKVFGIWTTSNGVACKSFIPISALCLEKVQHSSMTECMVWQDELSGTCADSLIDESFKDEVRNDLPF